jgi:hypothetical protein
MTGNTATTSAYDRFLAQLRATGREKLDGIDGALFGAMTPPERADARRLLEIAARRGDAIAALGLIDLDGAGAVPILREALPAAYTVPATPRALVLGALLRLTGDAACSDALATLIADIEGTDALVRQTALVQLQNRPASVAVRAALWRSVRDEPDKTVRFLAAKQLLFAAGLITDVHQRVYPQRDVVRVLTESEGAPRAAAVRSLELLVGQSPQA